MTILNKTKSGFLKKVFLLSALAMPQAVIAMDAEQERAAKEMARQQMLSDADSTLTGLENLLQRKGWELQENNGVWDWQPGERASNFNDINRKNAYKTLSFIQQTGVISGELELRQRAGAIAHALGYTNMANAFSRPTDNFFDGEGMPPEVRLEIFGHAAGDGTESRTKEQLSTLLNLSEVDHQTHEDVRDWREVELTVANIKTKGWPEYNNLKLRAQINDRVLQKLVAEKFFGDATDIDLANTAITDEGLASLAQLPNFKRLYLSGCTGITDKRLASLAQLPNLMYLNLSGCPEITGEGLASLAQLSNFKGLDLSDCPEITDEGLASLAQLPNLMYLNLSGCPEITDKGLIYVGQLMELESLDLSDCPGITGEGLASLAQLPKIEYLFLSGCPEITDEGLIYVGQLRELCSLHLSGCTGITDGGLASLAPLENLLYLFLNDCPGITDEGLASLAQLSNLRILHLSGCTGITMDALQELRNKLQRICIQT